jgi:hypothetical protein
VLVGVAAMVVEPVLLVAQVDLGRQETQETLEALALVGTRVLAAQEIPEIQERLEIQVHLETLELEIQREALDSQEELETLA